MKEPSYDIGNVIRSQRKLRNMSLSEASEKTGVSKAMLAQIERNESCPTISTVWKISSGLQIPIATLLAQHKSTDYKVNKLEDVAQLENEEKYIRVYNLFPFDPFTSFDYLYIELDPHSTYPSTGHKNALEEYVVVTSGKLTLHIAERIYELETGDSITFNGDEDHSYENADDEVVIFQTMMRY